MRKPPEGGYSPEDLVKRTAPKFDYGLAYECIDAQKSRKPNQFVHGIAFSFLTAGGGGLAVGVNSGERKFLWTQNFTL